MEQENKFLSARNAFKAFFLLVLFNLLFLDFVLVNNQKDQAMERKIPLVVSGVCPSSCLSEVAQIVEEATRSTNLSVTSPTPVSRLSPTIKPTSQIQSPSLVKEFFVPFGAGSNSSDDWQDIAGLKVTLDPQNYGSVKTVVFEATVRIPTGNETAYVRLYNITDKHPVWFSDVSLDGGVAQLLISKPITLDSGNKTYQVQMKTSLKYPAFLDQSRLHIITN
jgi:hypothetical protein